MRTFTNISLIWLLACLAAATSNPGYANEAEQFEKLQTQRHQHQLKQQQIYHCRTEQHQKTEQRQLDCILQSISKQEE